MKTYRVAVIGHTGKGNYGHGIDTVWLKVPQCEIVAVADADEKGSRLPRRDSRRRRRLPITARCSMK